jgi:hypothetical protein
MNAYQSESFFIGSHIKNPSIAAKLNISTESFEFIQFFLFFSFSCSYFIAQINPEKAMKLRIQFPRRHIKAKLLNKNDFFN